VRTHVSLFADDLLRLERGSPEPMDTGECQFHVGTGEPYLYVTADQLEGIADHFLGLAHTLRKELT